MGCRGGIALDDHVFAARLGERLVGLVRLVEEHGVLVLRGMRVTGSYRRKGVGKMLLRSLVPYLDRHDVYGLPNAHLVTFYGEIGFEVVHPGNLPALLQERLQRYSASGVSVLPMRRDRRSGRTGGGGPE